MRATTGRPAPTQLHLRVPGAHTAPDSGGSQPSCPPLALALPSLLGERGTAPLLSAPQPAGRPPVQSGHSAQPQGSFRVRQKPQLVTRQMNGKRVIFSSRAQCNSANHDPLFKAHMLLKGLRLGIWPLATEGQHLLVTAALQSESSMVTGTEGAGHSTDHLTSPPFPYTPGSKPSTSVPLELPCRTKVPTWGPSAAPPDPSDRCPLKSRATTREERGTQDRLTFPITTFPAWPWDSHEHPRAGAAHGAYPRDPSRAVGGSSRGARPQRVPHKLQPGHFFLGARRPPAAGAGGGGRPSPRGPGTGSFPSRLNKPSASVT